MALASAVHLLTLACVAGGLWLVVSTWFEPATVLGLVVVLIGLSVGPRTRRERAVTLATEVPALNDFVRGVADQVGGRPPDGYVVDGSFDIEVERTFSPGFRPLTVLRIGRLRWVPLSDAERRAVLAVELGHQGARDPLLSWFVSSARRSLAEWQFLFFPRNGLTARRLATSRRYVEYVGPGAYGGFATVAEYVVPVVLLPFFVAVSGLAAAYAAVVDRGSRRAHLLAIRRAVDVAGSAATRRVLLLALLDDAVRIAISSHRASGGRALPSVLAAAALSAVPETEVERRLRRDRLVRGSTSPVRAPVSACVDLVDASGRRDETPVAVDRGAVDAEVARL